jgi:hypothetical protein
VTTTLFTALLGKKVRQAEALDIPQSLKLPPDLPATASQTKLDPSPEDSPQGNKPAPWKIQQAMPRQSP